MPVIWPRKRAQRRRVGAVTAALFLANLIAVSWHEARELHVVCAEHGEIVDATIATTGPSPDTQHVSLTQAPPVSPDDDHHCTLCTSTTVQVAALQRFVEPLAVTFLDGARSSTDVSHRSIALLRLAPKSSPPGTAAIPTPHLVA